MKDRSTKESTIRRKLEVQKYEGGNEIIDGLMARHGNVKFYIVNGSWGRVPVIANSIEAAKDRYVEKFSDNIKQEEEQEKFE